MLLEPTVHKDGRGFFVETFRANELATLGIADAFVQDNHSRSVRGTLRGLHYQAGAGQAKLVRVARGEIWDVVVDLRTGSETLGAWEAHALDDVTHRALYVPPGFAHGFCVISEIADVLYRVSAYYDARAERGIAWDDASLAISWPVADPILSDRDQHNPSLQEVRAARAGPGE